MNDPYEVLGLPEHADEVEVRRRYLELVRQFPPDRAPERFAAIRAAYDAVRDPIGRIHAQIFEIETEDTIDAMAADLRHRLRDRQERLPVETLLALAQSP